MQLPDGIKITPMLEQYITWKDKYPDCLLFFRMGDFYEMFFDDAKIASSVLDIALTSRSKDAENQIPMAGVPFHSVDNYIGRLVAAGYRIAICEQMTEPDGKTLVERSVNRIITSGTYITDASDGRIAACVIENTHISLAFLDTSDGTLRAGTFPLESGVSALAAFAPDEILLKRGETGKLRKLYSPNCAIYEKEKNEFSPANGSEWLCRRWNIATLAAMGIDDRDACAGTAAAALRYLEETQFSNASYITSVMPLLQNEKLILDQNTQINLELVDNSDTSLMSVLDKTVTAMGKRKLREWITEPLRDIAKITERQNMIEVLVNDAALREKICSALAHCRDIAKALSRITLKMSYPADLLALKETLNALPSLAALIFDNEALSSLVPKCDLSEFAALLSSAVADRVPRHIKDGGFVKEGYNSELDEWRSKAQNSSEWMSHFEERERERTGIKNLKIGVNKVFGYYIEISRVNAANAPASYVRRQTLVNCERFITEELKKFEEEMFGAELHIQETEERIYKELNEAVINNSEKIHSAAEFIAALDVVLSLASAAAERGYTRPVIDMSKDFVIKNARHPVIEVTLGKNPFTPNDFNFTGDKRIAIITGPNMAGKSTYLRTAALIAVMAHMGSFIPADSAVIGLIDRVFTRIGARDELARGQSTFMVEMVETANILRHATDRSLIILDEVGRGTSTYDGLSIAWAVVEYLQGHDNCQPRVYFATHYHELTQMADILTGIVNLSMSVDETENGVVFLHKIIEAPSDRSYGIEVARLAGIPAVVLCRSKELLAKFEKEEKSEELKKTQANQITMFDTRQDAIIEELAVCSPDNMTPLSALEMVMRLHAASREVLGFNK